MAQFRATIQGGRGEASRLGSKTTGIDASINGWTGGVRVVAEHIDGKDIFRIFATNGSGYRGSNSGLIGYVDEAGTFHREEA